MSNTIALLNSTLATPLNKTETIETLNTTLWTSFQNSTRIPYFNTTFYPNFNSSINGNWNYTIYSPYYPDYPNYVTIDAYAYYALILILLIVAIVAIKVGISRRKELERRAAAERRRAQQQVTSAYVSTNTDNSNSNDNNTTSAAAKDLPPAYDEIVQSYMFAKQQQTAENNEAEGATGMTTNPSSVTISTAISTFTIDTEISNSNHASTLNLNNPLTSSMTEATIITSAPTSSPPPSYNHVEIEMSTTKTSNDNIV